MQELLHLAGGRVVQHALGIRRACDDSLLREGVYVNVVREKGVSSLGEMARERLGESGKGWVFRKAVGWRERVAE